MAEGEGGSSAPTGSVTLPFIVMGVLIVLFVAGGIAFKKDKPKPFKTEGSRAVVLPAAERQRTVVVPPCSPQTVITAEERGHSDTGSGRGGGGDPRARRRALS